VKRPDKNNYDFNDNIEGVRFAYDMIKYADYLEDLLSEKEKERGIVIIGPKSDIRLIEHLQRLAQTDKKTILIGAVDFGKTTLSEKLPFSENEEMKMKMMEMTKIPQEYFGEKSQSKYHK
jgi:hypothetical protein